ncbi:MAG: ComF family protein [Candidatus Fimenecus sp.]
MNLFFQKLLIFFFPNRCYACGEVISAKKQFCKECESEIEKISEPICIYCGIEQSLCKCSKRKNDYDGIIAPFYYSKAIKKAIHNLKFNNRIEISKYFAEKMTKIFSNNYSNLNFDCICFIPFSEKDTKTRRYNQSELLANEISYKLNIPVFYELEKLYEIPKQHSLKAIERSGNVFGVFKVKNPEKINNKNILLIDDIKTTGSTLSECSKMLKLSGAKSIYCLTAAITKIKSIKS